MTDTKLIAGWPLATWLGLLAGMISGAFVGVQYYKFHVIRWEPLALFVLVVIFAIGVGRRDRGRAAGTARR